MNNLKSYICALKGPILVTGASGFVGANLFKAILAVRSDVFACIKANKGWRLSEVSNEHILDVDLNDANAIKNLIHSILPSTIFNLAAYGAYSFEQDSRLIYLTNFHSVVNLVSAFAEIQPTAFVHAGSSSEYGLNCTAPPESSQCVPNSHYAVSKLATAEYLAYMGRQRNFPCVNLRLYSVYGSLEDSSRLIPNLLRHALQGKLPPFVHPDICRDFVHINDVCAAFIFAAVKMNPEIYGENINIGTGTKVSIRELAKLAQEIFGVIEEPHFGSMENREWDLSEWYADPSQAKLKLGWTATIGLAEGLRLTSSSFGSMTNEKIVAETKMPQKARRSSISAIVACYKDEQAIKVMYQRLTQVFNKLDIEYEIILINDCSPDNSAEIIRQISEADPHVIGVSHSRNFGSQLAFRSGMEISTMDAVVLLDGDLQDPPEIIESFHRQWSEGFEVVYGRRIKRDMPWYWEILYKSFYRLFANISYIKIPLDAGDFSLIDRRVVNWILRSPERDLFLRGLRAYVGFKQCGVDYIRPERMFGRSTNNFYKNIEWAKKGIFSYSSAPLVMLFTLGLLLLTISIGLAILSILLKLFMPEIAPRGVTTLLVGVLFFGSINLFAIGVLGEYISKIMIEVKGRPMLIRESLIRHGKITDFVPDGKKE